MAIKKTKFFLSLEMKRNDGKVSAMITEQVMLIFANKISIFDTNYFCVRPEVGEAQIAGYIRNDQIESFGNKLDFLTCE